MATIFNFLATVTVNTFFLYLDMQSFKDIEMQRTPLNNHSLNKEEHQRVMEISKGKPITLNCLLLELLDRGMDSDLIIAQKLCPQLKTQ